MRVARAIVLPSVLLVAACASSPPPRAEPVVTTSSTTTATSVVTVTSTGTDAAVAAPVDAAAPAQEAALARYREAMAAVEQTRFTDAARLFGEAYALAPSLELAFNTFRMHERSASVDAATEWYTRALSHNPPAALRADLDQRMAGLRDFARRRREDIARPPPGNDALVAEAGTFFARGVSLYQRRQYAPALQAFEAALRFMQESQREVAELYFNLAVTHEHLGHRAEAAAAFREYLSRRPDTPDRASVEARVRTLTQ